MTATARPIRIANGIQTSGQNLRRYLDARESSPGLPAPFGLSRVEKEGGFIVLPKNKRDRAIRLFRPNKNGESGWVPVEQFAEAGLTWTKNGNMRRGVAFGISDIKWEVKRVGGGRSAVVSLRMSGWNYDSSFDQVIVPAVRQHFDGLIYCNVSMLPIPKPDREVDHRFGNKDHPDYVKLYKPENQTHEHFQLIHRVLNLQKRQICIRCVEDQSRPAHPTLGYAEGDSSLAERFPCKGCYLAEPERYRGLTD